MTPFLADQNQLLTMINDFVTVLTSCWYAIGTTWCRTVKQLASSCGIHLAGNNCLRIMSQFRRNEIIIINYRYLLEQK